MYKPIILLVATLTLFGLEIFPQACCTVGTSVSSGVERGVINYKSLSAAFSFQHNVLNSTFQSTNEIEDPLNRKSAVSDFTLELEYGLAERVSVLLLGGYTNKSRTTTFTDPEINISEEITFTGDGFTDIVILGKYELVVPDIVLPLGASIGAGAKLPTGSYTLEENGTRLSIDLQPGTGASDLLLWGHINYAFPILRLSINANVLYRYTGTNIDNYRYGDEVLASINGSYGIADFLAINLQLRGRYADRDHWDGRFLPSTGGTYIDLTPSFIYVEGNFNLRILAQIPLYRNVSGIQLTVSEKLGAEMRYLFDLN
ncbi:MAG: hypothetical protein HKM87_04980 [Ignavibacteriaceae bacterium]|nr:hypothetical protein [Ignavibacteriaceae bacterium]